MFIKKLVQSSIKGLARDNLIEKKLDSDLSQLKLVQLGDNDMLTRQPIEN
jgi:hypothetical protein